MFRTLGAALGVATLAGLAVLAFSGTASADGLTSLTADAAPSKVMVGESVTATITVTNTSSTPIEYGTIGVQSPFEDCRKEIGVLQPEQSVTVTCVGVFDEPVRDRYSVTIANAPGESVATSAENGLHIRVEEPVSPTPSETPSETPSATPSGTPSGTPSTAPGQSDSPPVPAGEAPPVLPTTGARAGSVALAGASMIGIALVVFAGLAVHRRLGDR